MPIIYLLLNQIGVRVSVDADTATVKACGAHRELGDAYTSMRRNDEVEKELH